MNSPLTLERFWQTIVEDPTTHCWVWLASRTRGGYCQVKIAKKHVYVHRWAFEMFRGPIPEGMEIDHLCRNRACANPVHLQAVTHAENVRRGAPATKGVCKYGHPLVAGKSQRVCRVCRKAANRRYETRKKEIANG